MHRIVIPTKKRVFDEVMKFLSEKLELRVQRRIMMNAFCHEIEVNSIVVCSSCHAQLELRVIQDMKNVLSTLGKEF